MPSQPEPVALPLLLETKFFPPRSPRALVPRPRLAQALQRVATSRLTLVSAPAGFGKSTVLAQWLTGWLAPELGLPGARSAAWLSLDKEDNDPRTFWTYLIGALRTAVPGVGADALGLLHASQPATTRLVLTTLLHELGTVDGDLVLVLDDYHLVESREVHEGMAFLVDHLPAGLHLVIAGRADPALPLARLRAGGELVEARAADLRFTAEEALAYLNDVMGLRLTADDVAALDGRTEGWIAALQLAALSMQGRADASEFIAGFAGDDRYIVDYLAEEVLSRQPAEVRDFLLRTSILTRLTGPLCDAVTGGTGGRATLEALDRGNLFLVPLDDRRRWYRYHHLFADVLRAHLQEDQDLEVAELHRRASGWFEQQADPSEAVRHALAGGDFARAAGLMELAVRAKSRDRQEAELRGWLRALPDEVVRVRPVLNIGFVGALASGSQFEGLEERLRDIERFVPEDGSPPPPEMVVVDEERFPLLRGGIAMYRAALALARGDLDGTLAHGRRAVELAPEDDTLTRSSAAALSGLASWAAGDLAEAHRAYLVAVDGLQRAGWVADVLGCSIAVSDIERTQGRLGDAMRTCQRALELAAAAGGTTPMRGSADMHVGIAEVLRERDDLAGAAEGLAVAERLGEHNGLPQNPYRFRVGTARLREIEGDLDGALVLLDEAVRVYVGDFSPDVRPVPATRARLQIRRGDLPAALAWAAERRLAADDELSYLREYEHLTLARLLLARHLPDEASGLLARLLAAAEQGERAGTVLEVLVLQALAHQANGDTVAALAALRRAVKLAEPEGFVRLFADEGAPMAALLKALAKEPAAPAYARRLLAATVRTTAHRPVTQALVEPLSERELDVLRLLGTDLDGPDIARELTVSLNTLRTHTRNIYAKLGVTSRREAVSQARTLDLLPGSRR